MHAQSPQAAPSHAAHLPRPGDLPIPSPGETESPWRPSGGACGPPLTPVPQVARRLLAGHARTSARSSGCPERKEVALGGGGERSRSHPEAGVQPRRQAEMAAKPGLGYLRRSRSAGVVPAVGRLQTPRRRCQATVRREEGSRVCGRRGGGGARGTREPVAARLPGALRCSSGAAEGTPSHEGARAGKTDARGRGPAGGEAGSWRRRTSYPPLTRPGRPRAEGTPAGSGLRGFIPPSATAHPP